MCVSLKNLKLYIFLDSELFDKPEKCILRMHLKIISIKAVSGREPDLWTYIWGQKNLVTQYRVPKTGKWCWTIFDVLTTLLTQMLIIGYVRPSFLIKQISFQIYWSSFSQPLVIWDYQNLAYAKLLHTALFALVIEGVL